MGGGLGQRPPYRIAPRNTPAENARKNMTADTPNWSRISGPATAIAWLSTPSSRATKAQNTKTLTCSADIGLSSISFATSTSSTLADEFTGLLREAFALAGDKQ